MVRESLTPVPIERDMRPIVRESHEWPSEQLVDNVVFLRDWLKGEEHELETTVPLEKEGYRVYDFEKQREQLPEETAEQAVSYGLAAMRDIMNGQEYTLYGSTGLYLYGKKYGIEELQTLPGDFDANVRDEVALQEVEARLRRVPGVRFQNEATPLQRKGSEGALYLSGWIDILMKDGGENGEDIVVAYPFEIFANSRLVPEELDAYKTDLYGLPSLNLEGLQQQYLTVLSFESKIGKSVDVIADFLLLQRNVIDLNPTYRSQVVEGLDVSNDQLDEFYELVDRLGKEGRLEDLTQESAGIFTGGLKTKQEKREKDIKTVRNLRKSN